MTVSARPPRLGLIIVAAGSSSRMVAVDKVWALLGTRPMLHYAVMQLAPLAHHTVVVVRAGDLARAQTECTPLAQGVQIVPGGSERQESVAAGLAALEDIDLVAVHDAARPFASANLLRNGVAGLADNDGAVPALPVADTIKQVNDIGRVEHTVPRSALRRIQTPQVFRASSLWLAHDQAASQKWKATDDASLLEQAGLSVVTFPGEEGNFKLTTEHDLRIARLMITSGLAVCPE